MININNLVKKYGEKTVLKNISFSINEGDIFGIIGKSGSGKTTLLDCISGLQAYDSGEISIDGKILNNLSSSELREVRKNIGFVFQNFSLLSRKNVLDNISLPMKCWNFDRNIIKDRSRELAKLVGLEEHLHKKPRELSGGQKQRVAIARALSLEPNYIVCDEFTSALDPATTNSIISLMMEIKKKRSVTFIIVTHDMDVAKRMCNKMIVLEDGIIADSGTTEAVFNHNSLAIQKLLGEVDEDDQ